MKRLKQSVFLDDDSLVAQARKAYNAVKLNGHKNEDYKTFIEEYKSARTRMLEYGVFDDLDPKSVTMDITDFEAKIAGSPLMRYILELPEQPTHMESGDPNDSRITYLGRCRQFIHAGRLGQLDKQGSGKNTKQEESLLQLGPTKTKGEGG